MTGSVDWRGRHGSSMKDLLAKIRSLLNDNRKTILYSASLAIIKSCLLKVLKWCRKKNLRSTLAWSSRRLRRWRPHGPPYIWAVFLMPKSCNFRLFFWIDIPFSLKLLIISITYKLYSILYIFSYSFYKKKFWQKCYIFTRVYLLNI